MLYYSTNRRSPAANFEEASILGQAPDGGLYFPSAIPAIDPDLIRNIDQYSNAAIAFEVIRPFTGEMIREEALKKIVEETLDFDIPLKQVSEKIFSLEMFHGPTLAFKDVGARFMSRCLGYFLEGEQKRVTVLVATSGDTGGAVASGFHHVPNVNVVILYPSGKVSEVQEKQLTTTGGNITAIEVDGSFDDCQHMVKTVFSNAAQLPNLFLTSANSINIARWLPQQFYYFIAYKNWIDRADPPVFSVPSGNFGNICAGMLAQRSGLPVKHFIAACNANDIIPNYLQHDEYVIKKPVATISNAMDVAEPSNFVRILEMYHGETDELRAALTAVSVSDDETRQTIKKVHADFHYLLDPHGAVGYRALENHLAQHSEDKGIFIETAHPVKFYDVIEPIINLEPEMPETLKLLMQKEKRSVKMEKDPRALINFLSSGSF